MPEDHVRTDASLSLLEKFGQELVFLDGTYNLAEANLILHTLAVRHPQSKLMNFSLCVSIVAMHISLSVFFLLTFCFSDERLLPCAYFLSDSQTASTYARLLFQLRTVHLFFVYFY